MDKKKSKLKIIIFSLVPLLALLIAAELLLRVVYFQRNNDKSFAITAMISKIRDRNIKEQYHNRYIRLKEHLPSQVIFFGNGRDSSVLDSSYVFRTNTDCFILPQERYTDPEFSIVFIGGSTTECYAVKENIRFPYLVGQTLFQKTRKKIMVYNSGVSGNHTYHAIDLLVNKIVPMKPKYVILMECINDWTTLLFEGTYWNNNPTRSLIIDPNNQLPINQDEWAHLRGKKLKWNAEKIIEEFKKAQLTFISICKANNIEPILMTQANRYNAVPDQDITNYLKGKLEPFGLTYTDVRILNSQINNQIRENAKENNLLLVDLDLQIPRSINFMHDIVHYTDKGSILAAEIISNQLIKKIK